MMPHSSGANTDYVITLVNTNEVKIKPVADSIGGIQRQPGMHLNQITKELVGATQQLDLEYAKQNPVPDPCHLKEIIVTEASVGVVTSLDSKITLPCSLCFENSKKKGTRIIQKNTQLTVSFSNKFVLTVFSIYPPTMML